MRRWRPMRRSGPPTGRSRPGRATSMPTSPNSMAGRANWRSATTSIRRSAPRSPRLWLSVFPVSDLSLHLLATANIAVTLYIAWRTMRRYLSPDKTVFGLALLMLIPFFNFIALKYNANAVLLPLWALTIDAFLRAYERRKPGWAAAAGAVRRAVDARQILVGGAGRRARRSPRWSIRAGRRSSARRRRGSWSGVGARGVGAASVVAGGAPVPDASPMRGA